MDKIIYIYIHIPLKVKVNCVFYMPATLIYLSGTCQLCVCLGNDRIGSFEVNISFDEKKGKDTEYVCIKIR